MPSRILPFLTRSTFWAQNHTEVNLNQLLFKIHLMFQDLKNGEEGQDLVEYALVVALIAFGATAGMGALAGGINSAFNTISDRLSTSI